MNQTAEKSILIKELSKDWLENFSKVRKEPRWAADLRTEAYSLFAELPWPDPKSPESKRMGVNDLPLDKIRFSPSHTDELSTAEGLKRILSHLSDSQNSNGKTPGQVYWDFNKGFRRDIPDHLTHHGLEWLTFEEALLTKEKQVAEAWRGSIQKSKKDKFRLLNLALGNGGLCLFIHKNQALSAPLYQFFVGGHPLQSFFPLNFVFLGENSEAQIWEELVSPNSSRDEASNEPSFICSYTAFHLKKNAKTSLYFLQQWNKQTIHYQFHDVVQEADSDLNSVAIQVGGHTFRNDSTINLEGEGAQNKILGVLFGGKEQKMGNWITQNHRAQRTVSDIQFRGVLQGKAKSFFSGMVSITKEAQKSDAYQSSKSLLLSNDAKSESIPNLEILADDVKCAHGAAVAPVDEDQKYYLQTRGIPPKKAEKILIEGFFEPVIAAVPNAIVQERLREFIEEKLNRDD